MRSCRATPGQSCRASTHSFEQMWVDLFSGFIVTVFEAENQAALESEFERLGFPWDEVHAVQVHLDRPTLEQMVAHA